MPSLLRRASVWSERRCGMSTISHPPAGAAQEPGWAVLLRVTEVWASLAITAMWIAVSVTAVWVRTSWDRATMATARLSRQASSLRSSHPSARGRSRSTPSAKRVRSMPTPSRKVRRDHGRSAGLRDQQSPSVIHGKEGGRRFESVRGLRWIPHGSWGHGDVGREVAGRSAPHGNDLETGRELLAQVALVDALNRRPPGREPDNDWRTESDGVGWLRIFCPECWQMESGPPRGVFWREHARASRRAAFRRAPRVPPW